MYLNQPSLGTEGTPVCLDPVWLDAVCLAPACLDPLSGRCLSGLSGSIIDELVQADL
jgi:hypothetical protein